MNLFHATLSLPRWAALLCLAVAAAPAAANDYPTAERVLFVQSCMQEHPGPSFEMISKCSCTLDALAEVITYDEYVQLSTAAKAVSIGGERGSYIRDAEMLTAQGRRYRKLQAEAGERCMLKPAAQ